jgi:predicted PurR-regulated permease PerM
MVFLPDCSIVTDIMFQDRASLEAILLDRIERVWNAFFHGELLMMLVVGVMTTIGLAALGVPGALYLGLIAGLLEIIPKRDLGVKCFRYF